MNLESPILINREIYYRITKSNKFHRKYRDYQWIIYDIDKKSYSYSEIQTTKCVLFDAIAVNNNIYCFNSRWNVVMLNTDTLRHSVIKLMQAGLNKDPWYSVGNTIYSKYYAFNRNQ